MATPRRHTRIHLLAAPLLLLLLLAAPQQVAAQPAPPPAPLAALPLHDDAVFPDLTPRVTLRWPAWLPAPEVALHPAGAPLAWAAADGVPLFPLPAAAATPRAPTASWGGCDADADGIPDQADLLIGALRAAANGARYDATYYSLSYPGGDVPRELGVCTDVVIRALRNAGYDLQRLVHEDIRRRPRAYPMVKRASHHIDHRRVRTLLPWLEHHADPRPPDPRASLHDWLPGDIVLMDTLPRSGPDHIGVVADTAGPSGLPLIINNWTDGYTTQPMDLLAFVPITHRFRLRCASLPVASEHQGPDAALRRAGLPPLPDDTRQLLLVTANAWDASVGTLRRYARASAAAPWAPVGAPVRVGLGSAGLAWGRGLHGEGAPPGARPGPAKAEGDRRSPAGTFDLGDAFGAARPPASRWPFRSVGHRDVFVDDPASPLYNTWQRRPASGDAPWASAEALAIYRLGVLVEHNPPPVRPGAGSAIFLHGDDLGAQTLGCTALAPNDLKALIAWLDPAARPRLVQIIGQVL